jgi:S-adenosylmethionine uptake transporter
MKTQHLIGVCASLMAFLAYSFGDALRKGFSIDGYNPFYIMLWSSLLVLIALVGFSVFRGRFKEDFTVQNPKLLALRSMSNIVLGYFAILSFKLLPMTDAYILIMTAPIFGIIYFSLFFHEKLHAYKVYAVLLGFAGALLVIKPGFGEWNMAYFAAIMVAVIFVVNNALSKKLVHVESKMALIVYPNIFNLFVGLIILRGHAFTTPGADFPLFILSAVFSLIGAIGMVLALKRIEASQIGLYHYTQVFYGVVIGFFFFAEVPDIYALGGLVAIFLSGLVIYKGSKRRHDLEYSEINL